MIATLSHQSAGQAPFQVASAIIEDPLALDAPDDRAVITTRRAICRVATVAAEAGARFQRESDPTDPVAWMLAPRRLFGGAAALDACLELDNFIRAIMLHGLSLGVDADPGELDLLLQHDGDDDDSPATKPPRCNGRRSRGQGAQLRLFSATVAFTREGMMLQVFHASLARDSAEIAQRLRARFGDEVTRIADIRPGFHPTMPLALALVPGRVADLIRSVEQDCSSPACHSFCVNIEQRLEA